MLSPMSHANRCIDEKDQRGGHVFSLSPFRLAGENARGALQSLVSIRFFKVAQTVGRKGQPRNRGLDHSP